MTPENHPPALAGAVDKLLALLDPKDGTLLDQHAHAVWLAALAKLRAARSAPAPQDATPDQRLERLRQRVMDKLTAWLRGQGYSGGSDIIASVATAFDGAKLTETVFPAPQDATMPDSVRQTCMVAIRMVTWNRLHDIQRAEAAEKWLEQCSTAPQDATARRLREWHKELRHVVVDLKATVLEPSYVLSEVEAILASTEEPDEIHDNAHRDSGVRIASTPISKEPMAPDFNEDERKRKDPNAGKANNYGDPNPGGEPSSGGREDAATAGEVAGDAALLMERDYFRRRLIDARLCLKMKQSDHLEEVLEAWCPHQVPWCHECEKCESESGQSLLSIATALGGGDAKKGLRITMEVLQRSKAMIERKTP